MVTELDIKLALNYAKNEGLKEGLAKGEAKGLKEGLAKGEAKLKQTAAKLKKLGVSVSDIVTATGLPEDVVEAL